MNQEVKAFVAKPDNLSLTSGTHILERETDSCKLSSNFRLCVVAHLHTYGTLSWPQTQVCLFLPPRCD